MLNRKSLDMSDSITMNFLDGIIQFTGLKSSEIYLKVVDHGLCLSYEPLKKGFLTFRLNLDENTGNAVNPPERLIEALDYDGYGEFNSFYHLMGSDAYYCADPESTSKADISFLNALAK